MKLPKAMEKQILEMVGEIPRAKSKEGKRRLSLRPLKSEDPIIEFPTRMTWELWIPQWFPSSANKREYKHWSVGRKQKKSDKEMVSVYFSMSGIPQAKGRRSVRIRAYYPSENGWHDRDNLRKSAYDALVSCQAIRDDNQKWCLQGSVKQFMSGPGKPWGTSFIISTVPPERRIHRGS